MGTYKNYIALSRCTGRVYQVRSDSTESPAYNTPLMHEAQDQVTRDTRLRFTKKDDQRNVDNNKTDQSSIVARLIWLCCPSRITTRRMVPTRRIPREKMN